MRANQQLTRIIAGRTIRCTSHAKEVLGITFDDGSVLKVQTARGGPYIAANSGRVRQARQESTALILDLEGGGNVPIVMARATSSVVLLNEAGETEYAD